MNVLMLDGPRKGEVQEVPFVVARDLVLTGRARDLRDGSELNPPAAPVTAAARPVTAPPKKRK
jgi:hypothetical protein